MDERREPGPPAGPAMPGERRRLARPPGDRYASKPSAGGTGATGAPVLDDGAARKRAIVTASLAAAAGAVLVFLLGFVDLGLGVVAIGAFIGWIVGVALIWWGRGAPGPRRGWLAAGLAAGSVVAGMLLEWGFSLVQGGALGPLDYAGSRYGAVTPLAILAAAAVAAFRAR